jgi:hypothetical protein
MPYVGSAKRLTVAAFVVFLHYVPGITLFMKEEERYCGWWSAANAVRILAGTVVLAAAAVGLDGLWRRLGRPWPKRVFDHLFLLALVSGLLAAFPAMAEQHPRAVNWLWGIALLAIAVSLALRSSRLVRAGAALSLILAPLMPILFVQMLGWPRWHETREPLPQVPLAKEAGTPVFVFVFDEWSWLRSTSGGQWLPELRNVRALCQQAVVCTQAVSPHRDTQQSLPRIIYQTAETFAVRDGRTLFEESQEPTTQFPSLFRRARQQGYRSYLLGYDHPYRHVLGAQVDCCRSYFAGDEAALPEQLAGELLDNSRHWTDPLSRAYGPRLLARWDARNWYLMNVRYRADMLGILATCPARSIVFCHLPTPHMPYVFNADGSYHGIDATASEEARQSDLEGYRRQLGYVDTLVGRIVQTLGEAGKFRAALLVFTSDHGWRFDPDPAFRQAANWDRRVPLIVKLPRQHGGRIVDEAVLTNRLRPLFEAAFGGKTDSQELLELIRRGATSGAL